MRDGESRREGRHAQRAVGGPAPRLFDAVGGAGVLPAGSAPAARAAPDAALATTRSAWAADDIFHSLPGKRYSQQKTNGPSPEPPSPSLSQVEAYEAFLPWIVRSRVLARKPAEGATAADACK